MLGCFLQQVVSLVLHAGQANHSSVKVLWRDIGLHQTMSKIATVFELGGQHFEGAKWGPSLSTGEDNIFNPETS